MQGEKEFKLPTGIQEVPVLILNCFDTFLYITQADVSDFF